MLCCCRLVQWLPKQWYHSCSSSSFLPLIGYAILLMRRLAIHHLMLLFASGACTMGSDRKGPRPPRWWQCDRLPWFCVLSANSSSLCTFRPMRCTCSVLGILADGASYRWLTQAFTLCGNVQVLSIRFLKAYATCVTQPSRINIPVCVHVRIHSYVMMTGVLF